MRVLVTGHHGQVARSLAERGQGRRDLELLFVGRPELDLAQPGKLARAIAEIAPGAVINAAAFTAVDLAESEEELAFRVNAVAAGEGAEAAAVLDIPFIQISTDFVFDGGGTRARREDDPVAPINAYGRTKAEGERRVLAASPLHPVVRTSWVVSPFGQNFVKTMLRLVATRDEIAVVADQRGSPTSAIDLADALLAMLPAAIAGKAGGVWHLAGQGSASRAELARLIMAASGSATTIRDITTADFPTPAARPTNSALDCARAKARLGIALPDWRDSVAGVVGRLV